MNLTAMFIYGGYREVLALPWLDASVINENYCAGGELEAAMAIDAVAADVDKAVAPILEQKDGPGIWYYDVAEKLGDWIAREAAKGEVQGTLDVVGQAVAMTNEWLREVNQ